MLIQEEYFLKVVLKSLPFFRLSLKGEFLVIDINLLTKEYKIEILDITYQLTRNKENVEEFNFTTISESPREYIEPLQSIGLINEININGNNNKVKNLIEDFKKEVYFFAKQVEFHVNPQNKIEEDNIRKSFITIKDNYIKQINNSLVLIPGIYTINISIKYKVTSSINKDVSYTKVIKNTFKAEEYLDLYNIEIDNFLGRIMSNILFAPSEPIDLSFPEYKPINI